MKGIDENETVLALLTRLCEKCIQDPVFLSLYIVFRYIQVKLIENQWFMFFNIFSSIFQIPRISLAITRRHSLKLIQLSNSEM